jgi:hypothetical protein
LPNSLPLPLRLRASDSLQNFLSGVNGFRNQADADMRNHGVQVMLCPYIDCLNMRISNIGNSSLSSSRSVDNSRRSPGKLHLSSSCNMRISNKRNSSLSSSRRRSADNLPLSSRCNMYNSLCNRRRSSGNLHCKRGTRPGNLCLKMGFLTVLLGQNRNDQNTSLVHLCCQMQT